jgi:hypothetical protein
MGVDADVWSSRSARVREQLALKRALPTQSPATVPVELDAMNWDNVAFRGGRAAGAVRRLLRACLRDGGASRE